MFERRFLPYWATGFVFVATLVILWAMGRNLICPCGDIRLWYAGDDSGQNSQHLLDWYAPSHLIHGLLFYGATFLVMRKLALGWRLLAATLVECAWEVVENTEAVINRYREFTVSGEYWGDAVINSAMDIGAMFLGFWLALRLPVWLSVAIIVGFELITIFVIRDGLALNVIMLLWPSEAILNWQSGI
ncbi:DUF2585 family protein [Aliiroseovarius subalbicans]|uniref:DUF2585 family protein n=1 Tax=Aliiroseovarius subalbicans TaxID=2925840 RepID=UPI001F5AA144|nr:DUF2585 family protein [Aliiroseovarius subalbicans]MCI2400220.1 DUF2585 family protein [Aliiroseovarius subalbicans]